LANTFLAVIESLLPRRIAMIGPPDKQTVSRATNAIMSAHDIVPGHDASTTDFILSITLSFHIAKFFSESSSDEMGSSESNNMDASQHCKNRANIRWVAC